MNNRITELLICPECSNGPLTPQTDLSLLPSPYDSAVGLRCRDCLREFPIVDDVYVLWTDRLRELHLQEIASEDFGLDDLVMNANLEIYNKIADDYDEHSDKLFNYHHTLLFLKALAIDQTTVDRQIEARVCVDVGCGPGVGLDAGKALCDLNVGVDISLENLRHVATKGHVAILADSTNLPLADSSVQLVTCFAALHHFPSAENFMRDAHRVLGTGSVLLTGADPSDRLLALGPLAQFVWDARKPVYRFLSRFASRFYLHQSASMQETNDLAEHQRTLGGFSSHGLSELLASAGFTNPNVFFGLDPDGTKKIAVPETKIALLKLLSFQSPVKPSNWMSLSTISRKGA